VAERAVAQQALRERGFHLLRSFPPDMGLAVGMVADQSCFPMKEGVPTNAALAPGVDEYEACRATPRMLSQKRAEEKRARAPAILGPCPHH
jgi:hypothetical protein